MREKNLARVLDAAWKQYHQRDYLKTDPLQFPHRFSDPLDQEAISVLSALIAYGRVKQIHASLEKILNCIEVELMMSPKEFVYSLADPSFEKKAQKKFLKLFHRFNRGEDFIELFRLLGKSWKAYGSLGKHFNRHWRVGDETLEGAMNGVISDWKNWSRYQRGSSFFYLLSAPQDGSCCKRWCMLLRWLVRKDKIDLGLWSEFLPASQLVMPLDTHIGKMAQAWGLCSRKTLNWKSSLEVTRKLRAIDSNDPTRFDFALCRIGVLGHSIPSL